MTSSLPNRKCASCDSCGKSIDRRQFIGVAGLSSLSLLASRLPLLADTPDAASHRNLIPVDKNLDPAWVKSLFERGMPIVYRGADLKYIGMPVSGICTGQLYLSGEGKLWLWDIFNIVYNSGCDGPRYMHPWVPTQTSPVDQGFALQINTGDGTKVYMLDSTGFPDVSFRGEYPIGTIEYKNAALPVEIKLEAYSPFSPLNFDDSGLPATVFQFTVKNTSNDPVEATLAGWLQNAVSLHRNGLNAMTRRNQVVPGQGFTFLNCFLNEPVLAEEAPQPDILIEDWNKQTYDGWTVEGTSFGPGPILKSDLPSYMGSVGGDTDRVVNAHGSAPGANSAERDANTGKLTSKPFTIERNFINAWIGGGADINQEYFNIIVDGKSVAKASGANNNVMDMHSFDVRAWKGKEAAIEIVDKGTGPWGQISAGRITQSDKAAVKDELKKSPDFGTMGLVLLGPPAEHVMISDVKNGFDGKAGNSASVPGDTKLVGALGRKLILKPGESATVDFAIVWHFPNLKIHDFTGRYYATKFASAEAVAQHIAENFQRLSAQTHLWRDTWYDSTLPYWFLDRTFSSVSTLSTSTPYRFADGRFYSWEGVGSCDGTCAHVWLYAHSVARTFPELERITREHVDYGMFQDPNSGVIGFRGEFDRNLAVDAQSGFILRTYREHQMSPDDAFLKRVWPKVKKAFDPLLALDANRDGILEGAQMNTLDVPWFGQIAWMSSLYVGALRAGEQMAQEVGDADFEHQCRTIAENGTKNITAKLFNGEYFINLLDPHQPDSINSGTGCEIDQVFGQGWAHQIGLPRILPEKETRSALQALWKYNYAPDVGPYMQAYHDHRLYAAPGESGLLMCTFPQPGWDYDQARGKGPGFAIQYFNECWTGTEHQVAGHMIWEGLVQEGLAVERAIHDRHHPSKRNPWNEIECGDHYSRAMASYGVYIAASGYEYHGPKGHLGFAPRLTPENFRAAFTAAEGWGTFSQQITNGTLQAGIDLKSGKLRLATLALALPDRAKSAAALATATLNGKKISCTLNGTGNRAVVSLTPEISLQANDKLQVTIV